MSENGATPKPYEGFDQMPIAGKWREGRAGKSRNDANPYTGESLLEIPLADADDLDEAYRAAEEAQRGWAAMLPQERRDIIEGAARVLEQRKEEVIGWISREAGGVRFRAELEWNLVREGMKEAATYPMHATGEILPATIPGKENRVYREPVGVVGIISPWNFPMQLSNRSVSPALACGNGVVLKPASDTPVTGGLLLAKIYEEAGLPEGLLSVVIGSGSDIGDAFVEHPVPRVISFTGSTAVGQHIGELCGRHVKKASLELGGNGPLVILEDADLDLAVDATINGKFTHQGQVCMATNRVVVDRSIHDEFMERFVEKASLLKVGDPTDPDTDIGPIINQSQLEDIQEKVRDTVAAGAEKILGGEDAEGFVMPPTILSGVTMEMRAAKEEIFGPVAPVIASGGEEDALRIANDTEFGLSSAVFTRDLERGVRFARRVEAGMTHVNDHTINDEPNTAFGGEKMSGLGRFGGRWALDEFTTEHWVSVQHSTRTYPL